MRVKNIDAAIQLISRYRSVTLEEIESKWGHHSKNMNTLFWEFSKSTNCANLLTGFHNTESCTLCKAVNFSFDSKEDSCTLCVYKKHQGCTKHKTFKDIEKAESPSELLQAFRKRADYIENVVRKLKIETNDNN